MNIFEKKYKKYKSKYLQLNGGGLISLIDNANDIEVSLGMSGDNIIKISKVDLFKELINNYNFFILSNKFRHNITIIDTNNGIPILIIKDDDINNYIFNQQLLEKFRDITNITIIFTIPDNPINEISYLKHIKQIISFITNNDILISYAEEGYYKIFNIESKKNRLCVIAALKSDKSKFDFVYEKNYMNMCLLDINDYVLTLFQNDDKFTVYRNTLMKNDDIFFIIANFWNNDIEVMLAAINYNSDSVKIASADLKKNQTIISAAIYKDISAITILEMNKFNNDGDLILYIFNKLKRHYYYYKRDDKSLILSAYEETTKEKYYDLISPKLKCDSSFIVKLLDFDSTLIQFMDREMLQMYKILVIDIMEKFNKNEKLNDKKKLCKILYKLSDLMDDDYIFDILERMPNLYDDSKQKIPNFFMRINSKNNQEKLIKFQESDKFRKSASYIRTQDFQRNLQVMENLKGFNYK